MRKAAKGLTLVEVILSLVVLAILIVAIYRSYTFFLNNIAFYLQRADAHMQVDYAMDHFRLHVLSAVSVYPDVGDAGLRFMPGITANRSEFSFEGESNYTNITPDEDTDNAKYRYLVGPKGLVVERTFGVQTTEETLVSSYLKPQVNFTYTADTEPNFMTVTIDAGPKEGRISKTEGMRLWFTDVVNKE